MRKSGRLASIYDDDDSSSQATVNNTTASTSTNTKKFTPTIPAARRKKIVEDDVEEVANPVTTPSSAASTSNQTQKRKPLGAQRTTTGPVSGPLAHGPAGMTRSSSSRSSGSVGGVFSGASTRISGTVGTSSNADLANISAVQVDDIFACESGLTPVALTGQAVKVNSQAKDDLKKGLILLQLPPVLPRLAQATESDVNPETVSGMFDLPQADRWPKSAQGRLGKLRKYKSGRMVLELTNGFCMDVTPSVSADAKLMNILAIDPEFGQSFNLGQVEQHFVCTPDLEE